MRSATKQDGGRGKQDYNNLTKNWHMHSLYLFRRACNIHPLEHLQVIVERHCTHRYGEDDQPEQASKPRGTSQYRDKQIKLTEKSGQWWNSRQRKKKDGEAKGEYGCSPTESVEIGKLVATGSLLYNCNDAKSTKRCECIRH